jgi:hypothetical protein
VIATAERTIGIRRPADQVFRFLSDGRTGTQWRAGPLEIRRAEPETRIDFAQTEDGPVRLEGTFELEAMGDGTILTCSLRAEVPGWRGYLPGSGRSALDAELRALDDLRDLLER